MHNLDALAPSGTFTAVNTDTGAIAWQYKSDRPMYGGVLATAVGRLLAGGSAGAAAQTPIAALQYGLGTEEASDYRLRDAFQSVGAALLGNEKTGDLALHRRGYQDGARFCQCLHPSRRVRRIPVNLTRCIDHDRIGFDADAR